MADGRQHHAGRGREALDVATDLVDVLVAARHPEAAPGLRVEHGALIPQLGIGRSAASPHRVVVVVERRRALIDGRHERTTVDVHRRHAGLDRLGLTAVQERGAHDQLRAREVVEHERHGAGPAAVGVARGIAADLAVRVRP